MIYRNTEDLTIRDMNYEDAERIAKEEAGDTWETAMEKHRTRLSHRDQGLCITLCAVYQGNPAGYISVYTKSIEGPFGHQDLPEIVDFSVPEPYRRKGIGSALMDEAEKIASQYADLVYLGVGLHSGFGSAQRMYAKRGYIPDGSGVWHGEKPCIPFESCPNDDDLMLFMSKKLKQRND